MSKSFLSNVAYGFQTIYIFITNLILIICSFYELKLYKYNIIYYFVCKKKNIKIPFLFHVIMLLDMELFIITRLTNLNFCLFWIWNLIFKLHITTKNYEYAIFPL